ncbi:MAG: N-6 DNA methylase [Anaerolineae bacterium]|nr:N-6 DNA methylase [Anaerolineae bacterium]
MDTAARQQVAELVEKFESRKSYFRSQQYNETQVRVEFVNPLFEALGWDVKDSFQVTHEAYVQVEEEGRKKPKRPDYAFRTGYTDRTRFFVETKKPSVNLRDDPTSAYQVRRYGWSAKLPVSILTDFEEFSVYDCRIPPTPEDRAQEGRLRFYTYQDYLEKWDEIESLFSRRAVLENRLEDWIHGKKIRGAQEVDAAFLADLEKWREMLAKDIAQRNPDLSPRRLNTAVQMTLDRIIFLRICEDRGIEPYGRLNDLEKNPNIYAELTQFFRQADAKYNSGLFHFNKEKERDEDPDEWTLKLKIDNAPLKTIFLNLYYPHSPYAFDALPADILGQIYERFLGKVIEVGNQTVNVVEKPEVRKAGGVYYTPTYIVDYIVQNTVGKLLADKTPEQVAALRILDPACGSGSFLIGAYQHLLNWHLDYYKHHTPKTHLKAGLLRETDGVYSLTTAEKKRILKNNLYGVDLDQQAVEVTKLSLLLKLLEGETSTTTQIPTQTTMLTERVLPDLGDNIKWGNSLIGPDYYTQRQLSMWQMDEEELLRVKVFDWHDPVKGFGKIMAAGGFDSVIGNPPYRREKDYKYLLDEIALTAFGKKYRTARMDLWYYFVHRSLELLKHSGQLGFIVNAYWLNSTGSKKLISILRDQAYIEEIFFFSHLKVFENVSGSHMTILVKNHQSNASTSIRLVDIRTEETAESFVRGISKVDVFKKEPDQLFSGNQIDIQPPSDELLSKIERYVPLNKVGKIRQGIAENPASINRKTNESYNNRWKRGQGVFTLKSDELASLDIPKAEQRILRPYFDLSDIGRYYIANTPSLHLIYSTRQTCPIIDEYPAIRKHLEQFRPIMENRRETRKGSNSWWHLHWPRDEELWKADKIIVLQMAERPSCVPVFHPAYVPFSTNVFVPYKGTSENLTYFAGILNSKLIWKWYKHHAKGRGIGLEINGHILENTPVRTINFDDPADKARHERMVKLVETMLDLHRQLPQAANAAARDAIQAAITTTDREIDRLVYDLYGLTDDEIHIVEGG